MMKTKNKRVSRLVILSLCLSLAFAPIVASMSRMTVYASDTAVETTTTETGSAETTTETTSEDAATTHQPGQSGVDEGYFETFVDVPTPTIDETTSRFFETIGGKILGLLLKILSVGLILTCLCDLVFVAVPFTQGLFLSLERSGIPIVSNEAHTCAGVPREKPMNQQGRGSGGYGGYGGYGGGYGGMDDGMGGGYGMGGGNQQQQQAGGIKKYIKDSFVKLILVTAFAVFALSGAYIHVGYAIGDAVAGMLKGI